MKKCFIIVLSCLLIFSTRGQQLGKETWVEITHEVKQLLVNESIKSELESIFFCTKQDTLLSVFEEYKYFHLYVEEDTSCQKFEFCLSNYPYKSKNLIGFFILSDYLIFVHNELPDFLTPSEYKKNFSYTEHKLGDLIIMEDDTPCWIIENKNSQFRVLHYPAKQTLYNIKY
jgi:hypothetical protein